MATLASKLDEYQWIFFEKGIMHVWNELKRFSNSANTAQFTADVAHGGTDFVTHCNPDVAEQVNDPQALGRSDSITLQGWLQPTKPPTQYQG